jgi:hypothetical protein
MGHAEVPESLERGKDVVQLFAGATYEKVRGNEGRRPFPNPVQQLESAGIPTAGRHGRVGADTDAGDPSTHPFADRGPDRIATP